MKKLFLLVFISYCSKAVISQNISTAQYESSFQLEIDASNSNPNGITFSADGMKMYITSDNVDEIRQFDLSNPYNVSTLTYSQSFIVRAQQISLFGVKFNPEGTKMFIIGGVGDNIDEYNLSSAWNVSSATFVLTSINLGEPNPHGFYFRADGKKLYVTGRSKDAVREFNLTTAWDISSLVFLQSYSVAAQEATACDLFFNNEGTKMYIVGISGDDINEYQLDTAWNVNSASFLHTFSVKTQEANPYGLCFHPDGTKMYIVGLSGDDVNEYDLGTTWNVSSANFVQAQKITNWGFASGLSFNEDGSQLFAISSSISIIVHYALSTVWDINTAHYVSSFSIAAQETASTGLTFNKEGTKMYVIGASGDDVNEYHLSTAWDITSASYVQKFYIGTQDKTPRALAFNKEGTKMYILGDQYNRVNEYNLGTAWDVSTASYVLNLAIGSRLPGPAGISFTNNGTKMYLLGHSRDEVNEYNLSTAWDVSTAVYMQKFLVRAQDDSPREVIFNPTGTKMYITGASTKIHQYRLSEGICPDVDGDGLCAATDCNDNDNTAGNKQAPGTSCDDGNPNSNDDSIQADSCTCSGTTNPKIIINDSIVIIQGKKTSPTTIGKIELHSGQVYLEAYKDNLFENAAPQSYLTLDTDGNVTKSAAPNGEGGGSSQVNADWSASSGAAQILNKPAIITTEQAAAITANIAKISYPTADATKLVGIQTGAEQNTQSDWDETDMNNDAYIKNKPTLTGDNMGLGFIVSKNSVGNTTFSNTAGAVPILRLGNNMTYTSFDSGRSVEINALSGGGADDWGTQVVQVGAGLSGNGTAANPLINTITDTRLTSSEVRNIVSSMVFGNTETGIDVTYDVATQTLDFIADTGESNVQVDWDETDVNNDTYIKNKPSLTGDNMGLGFIVSKTFVGNTTFSNTGGLIPTIRLGSNLTYSVFDQGRSVEINTLDPTYSATVINSAIQQSNIFTSSTPDYIHTSADVMELSDNTEGRRFIVYAHSGNAQVMTTSGGLIIDGVIVASGGYFQLAGTTHTYIRSSGNWVVFK